MITNPKNFTFIALCVLSFMYSFSSKTYAQELGSKIITAISPLPIDLPVDESNDEDNSNSTTDAKDIMDNKNDDRIISERKEDFPWKGSLFFQKNEMSLIYSALDVINTDNKESFNKTFADDEALLMDAINQKSLNGENSEEKGSSETTKTLVYPYFYIDSTMFSDKDNWTIWINGKQIRSYQKNSVYDVKVVSDNLVYILWRPEDHIIENAISNKDLEPHDSENRIHLPNGTDFLQLGWNYKATNGNIYANSRKNIVLFAISPGQSFNSYKMDIKEGTSEPISVVINIDEY